MSVYPPRAQFEAITQIQKQLETMNVFSDVMAQWKESMQSIADLTKIVQDTLQKIDVVQLHNITRDIYSPQMSVAIQPALGYLWEEHPDIYREIVPELQPSPAPSSPLRQKKKARRRALAKATRMTSRTGDILRSLDGRIQSIPSSKVSNILSLLLGASSIAPLEYAHSINLLCFAIAVFLTFHHKE